MYPSDVTDKEWKILKPYFEPKKTGRPKKHDIKEVINAIRYVIRTGCRSRYFGKKSKEIERTKDSLRSSVNCF